jgi:hypothetical protein
MKSRMKIFYAKKIGDFIMLESEWRPHLESNQELTLRKGSLYPFNYEAPKELGKRPSLNTIFFWACPRQLLTVQGIWAYIKAFNCMCHQNNQFFKSHNPYEAQNKS